MMFKIAHLSAMNDFRPLIADGAGVGLLAKLLTV
jgi:hypothetical protein